MIINRYNFVGTGPGQIVPYENGDYVSYDDMMALIKTISEQDPDMSPRLAVLTTIFEGVLDVSEEDSLTFNLDGKK